MTEGGGRPLDFVLTGANRQDNTVFEALVDGVPRIRTPAGGRRRRPTALYGDKAYDAQRLRATLRARHIRAEMPRRRRAGAPPASPERRGHLGPIRWVIERTFARRNQFRRLVVRYERRRDIHEALTSLACALMCWSALSRPPDQL